MEITDFLIKLNKLKIKLKLEDNELNIKAPQGVLNKEIINELKQNKDKLIDFLAKDLVRNDYQPIPKTCKKLYYALSSAQKRFYVLQQLNPKSVAYNMPYIISWNKPFEISRIENTFKKLINRHESLRTSFQLIQNEPLQFIHDKVGFKLKFCKVSDISEVYKKQLQVFDLSVAPLVKVTVIETNGGDNFLMIDMHHIISDGISHSILEQDFRSIYTGEKLAPLKLQYNDYSEWQNSSEHQFLIKKQEKFWLRKFEGKIPVLNLPTDFLHTSNTGHNDFVAHFIINYDELMILKSLAKQNDLTLYMIILAVLNILLSKLSGQEDIVVGTPVSGREHPDLNHIVGLFVNTIVLRNDVKGDYTINTYLQKLRQSTIEAFENKDYQYENLVEKLKVKRDISRNPLFDVMLNLLNHNEYNESITNDDIISHYPISNSKFDINMKVIELTDKMVISIEYKASLFKESTINRMIRQFHKIIADLGKLDSNCKIKEIELIPEEIKHRKLSFFNENFNTQGNSLQYKLNESFRRNKDKIAIENGDELLSYSEIDYRSKVISNWIYREKIKAQSLIGIFIDDETKMILSILGILNQRCVFVPIDTNLPENRIKLLINEIGLKYIVTCQQSVSKLIDINAGFKKEKILIIDNANGNNENDCSNIKACGSDKLYIYFTSGSTGIPKSILGKNESLLQFINWELNQFNVDSSFRFSMLINIGFDASLRDIFAPLLAGGTICIPKERKDLFDNINLSRWINKKHITLIHCVPSIFKLINNSNLLCSDFKGLKYVLMSGEQIIPSELKKWYSLFANKIQLVNLYGATETTMVKTFFVIKPEDANRSRLPVGKPIPSCRIIILNKNYEVCDIGVPGELYVRTAFASYGYYNNKSATDECFIPNPFKNNDEYLIYKTGDIALENEYGEIVIIGRHDQQIKIRGVRIELGEIENTLLKINSIKESIVAVREIKNEKILCAYIVSNEKINKEKIKVFLSSQLPDYMIPSHIIQIKEIPLTINGKINRAELLKHQVNLESEFKPPSNELEKKLVNIWSEVLDVPKEKIGVISDFFELGGHSLKVLQVVSILKKEFDINFSLMQVYKTPNIKMLAESIMSSEVISSEMEVYNKENNNKVFCFPPKNGYGLSYAEISRLIPEINFYCFNFLDKNDLINYYANRIMEIQKEGSYKLLAYSAGCELVSLVAKELENRGASISNIILIDGYWGKKVLLKDEIDQWVGEFIKDISEYLKEINIEFLYDDVRKNIIKYNDFNSKIEDFEIINADIHFIHSQKKGDETKELQGRELVMKKYTLGEFYGYQGFGMHNEMLLSPYLNKNVEIIRKIYTDSFIAVD